MISGEMERVGIHFSIDRMLEVRRQTRSAILAISNRISAGMSEENGTEIARATLAELGLLRGWHMICVRFGPNTVLEYGVPSQRGVILRDDDIYFIDIGPICERCEGDGGETFVVGNDPDMRLAKKDVVTLWTAVHDYWRHKRATGRELYRFAEATARRMGWELNLNRMSGHRIGDFPHPHRYAGMLSEADVPPSPYVWILEIHIRHPTRPFGAFFEDLLMPEPTEQ